LGNFNVAQFYISFLYNIKKYASQCNQNKLCNAVHGKKKYALYEALSAHLYLVSLGWQDVAGAGCTGWTSSTVFFVGAPVLAAQVYSQWG